MADVVVVGQTCALCRGGEPEEAARPAAAQTLIAERLRHCLKAVPARS